MFDAAFEPAQEQGPTYNLQNFVSSERGFHCDRIENEEHVAVVREDTSRRIT